MSLGRCLFWQDDNKPLHKLGYDCEDSASFSRTEVECKVGKSEGGPVTSPQGLVSAWKEGFMAVSIWSSLDNGRGGTDVRQTDLGPTPALSSTRCVTWALRVPLLSW